MLAVVFRDDQYIPVHPRPVPRRPPPAAVMGDRAGKCVGITQGRAGIVLGAIALALGGIGMAIVDDAFTGLDDEHRGDGRVRAVLVVVWLGGAGGGGRAGGHSGVADLTAGLFDPPARGAGRW